MGDKYMAVSGLPDECDNHAVCIARLALDMIEMAENVMMGNSPVVSPEVRSEGEFSSISNSRLVSFAESDHRNPLGRGGDGSDRTSDAALLSLR